MAGMNVSMVAISEIVPYWNNPRKNEKAVDAVANSIKEYGFKKPILIDSDGVIIAGHTRRLAAIKIGIDTVPCITIADLDDDKKKAFRLADNRVSEFSEWDKELLEKEIMSIANVDFSDFGFEKEHIKNAIEESVGMKTHICPKCGMEWTAKEV